KVGTFRIVNGAKQGGNVASYFCLPDGRVLHAVAGPVDAATLLREAHWVVETGKLARLEGLEGGPKFKTFFRNAHAERLKQEHHLNPKAVRAPANLTVTAYAIRVLRRFGGLSPQAQVHLLLANYPLVPIEKVYRVVFENILGEKVSTLPVAQK